MMPDSIKSIADIVHELSKLSAVVYLDDMQLSDGLITGTINNAAVIACSDMGWLVPYVCSSTNVQLFLFQNFGHEYASGGMVDTIISEAVETIIVYGHSPCRYVEYLAKTNARTGEDENPHKLYSAPLESGSELYFDDLGRYRVLSEIGRMLEDPLIAPIAKQGKLRISGWFYKSSAKQLEVLSPQHESFVVPRATLPDSSLLRFVPDQNYARDNSISN